MNSSLAGRLGIVALLSLVSIPLHEFGHYTVYRLAGIPVHITLQSVRPVAPVSGPIGVLGSAAGPAFSLIAALISLVVAQYHPGFFWATAAFTNATLRLFPCSLDLLRAVQKDTPFSDEGDIALAVTHSPITRVLVILGVLVVAAVLAVLAARQYSFPKYKALKVIGIYLLSLAVGICVVLVDGMLHPGR